MDASIIICNKAIVFLFGCLCFWGSKPQSVSICFPLWPLGVTLAQLARLIRGLGPEDVRQVSETRPYVISDRIVIIYPSRRGRARNGMAALFLYFDSPVFVRLIPNSFSTPPYDDDDAGATLAHPLIAIPSMTAGVLHRGLIDNSPYSKRDFNLSPIPDIQPGLPETHRNIISVIRLELPLRASERMEDLGGLARISFFTNKRSLTLNR
ncbi:hypothetical protein TcasGA2_TC002746 [Tribolium castaneum]|uniref:Uncharacterized protein n=1 Tax=Tribolium castaneum TaxID=7070 RepID=D6WDM3_TRICA|nr:hypothetical protein TcasGA2_TC002746 [Tribolium castaneum]